MNAGIIVFDSSDVHRNGSSEKSCLEWVNENSLQWNPVANPMNAFTKIKVKFTPKGTEKF